MALLVAKFPQYQELSNLIWEAIMDAFEEDEALVTSVSALARPRVLYTIDGPAEEKGKSWRVPFTAYLADVAD